MLNSERRKRLVEEAIEVWRETCSVLEGWLE